MQTYSWPEILSALINDEDLSREQASWAMNELMSGEASEAQMAAFMIALRAKGESVQELSGLVDVMLENAIPLKTGSDALDIVGTGGDLVGTVNISSMASILAAATGVPVLKHGSRSASGRTGSSEMLEELGINLELSAEQVGEVFRDQGITFFFAPVFHPAMRHVGPTRKQLGIPTTFNFLGPLANPAQPIATALGVSNKEVAPLMAAELASRNRTAIVFRSADGLDELSTTATNEVWEVSNGEIRPSSFNAEAIGLPASTIEQLLGGDAKANAQVARDLFTGAKTENSDAIKDMVCLNAAVGIVSYELAKDPAQLEIDFSERIKSAFQKAQASLESGAALEKANSWAKSTQQF